MIVTDNGSSSKAAVNWIEKMWGIKGVTVSPYNSQANGKVEQPHWDIKQMLYKVTGAANTNKWYWFLHSVLWADRIRKRTGYSPYFMVTGLHSILPLVHHGFVNPRGYPGMGKAGTGTDHLVVTRRKPTPVAQVWRVF